MFICRPVPVSYTHLDVYKRQLMAWMRFQVSRHIKTAGLPVSFDVLFPEHRKDKNEKLKTLYLLHGYHGDRSDWLSLIHI